MLIQFTDAALVSHMDGVPLHMMYSNATWNQAEAGGIALPRPTMAG